MDIKEEAILGEWVASHWYYRSKAKAMLKYLNKMSPKLILDIGAGSGYFSKYLLYNTSATKAICVDIEYLGKKQEYFESKSIEFHKNYGPADADIVLMMDVLEHIDDDIGFLKEQISKVPIGTHFLITVPAFEFLWSGHDIFLGHKRRYTLNELEMRVREAGLEVVRGSYFFAFILPLVIIVRLLRKIPNSKSHVVKSDLKRHLTLVNWLLTLACWLELPVFALNRLAGTSVFCLARKNN